MKWLMRSAVPLVFQNAVWHADERRKSRDSQRDQRGIGGGLERVVTDNRFARRNFFPQTSRPKVRELLAVRKRPAAC